MKEMEQVMLEMETASWVVDIIVKKRKPPLKDAGVWVHNPGLNGDGTWRMPSYDILIEAVVESSEVNGLMNKGDSVNDNASPAEFEEGRMLKETKPPTYKC